MLMMEGFPEWLSVVPEPAASSKRRWSEMSSALRTNSDRLPFSIACLKRSTALRISSTSLFHARGTAFTSSKSWRDIVGAAVPVMGLFEKEVMVVPRGGIVAWTIDMFGSIKALDSPCLIES